jgi:hypothetical protein
VSSIQSLASVFAPSETLWSVIILLIHDIDFHTPGSKPFRSPCSGAGIASRGFAVWRIGRCNEKLFLRNLAMQTAISPCTNPWTTIITSRNFRVTQFTRSWLVDSYTTFETDVMKCPTNNHVHSAVSVTNVRVVYRAFPGWLHASNDLKTIFLAFSTSASPCQVLPSPSFTSAIPCLDP